MKNVTRWTFVQLAIFSSTLAFWVFATAWCVDRYGGVR